MGCIGVNVFLYNTFIEIEKNTALASRLSPLKYLVSPLTHRESCSGYSNIAVNYGIPYKL